jgi:hypothetical protein
MATLISKPDNLAASGPLVTVKLWVPRHVESTCAPIDTLAEIDTAIARTCVQEGVATSLGLETIGTIKITTTTAPMYEAHVFRIRLVFPEWNMAFEVNAVEVPYMLRPHVRIKCLIGRDILKHSVLTYNGLTNMFSLSF